MTNLNNSHTLTIEKVLHQAASVAFANRFVKVSGERRTINLPGRDIDIVYYPAPGSTDNSGANAGNAARPLIAGFHGGGFIFGGCCLDDIMWSNVCQKLDVNIASIGYRQGPDHKWKDCLSDCYESILYLYDNADLFGFDRNHISVMGQSAGGNLAAATTLKLNESHAVNLDNQILVYPLLDLHTDPDEKGPGSFGGDICRIMNELHINPEEDTEPLASPAYATDEMLKESPKCIIIYCERDNLRHEAIRYADRLRSLGNNVAEFMAHNMPHGFFESGFKDRITDMEFDFLGENGRAIVEDGSLRRICEEALNFIKCEFILH